MTTRRELLAGAGLAALAAQLPVVALAQAKDSVTIAQTLEPPTLDPTSGAAQAIREVTLQNIFEGLVKIDRTGKLQPCLAESWQIADDNMTYRFKLRQGAKFHDDTPFTSEQVKFSFERAVAADSTNAQRQLFTPIAEITTPDPATVVIKLKQPTANFLFGLAWGDAVIVAPASAANNKTNPVGTGPFKFVRWNRGDRLELARNDSYWGEKPALAKATFRFMSDPQAQFAALRAGDVDAHTNLSAPEAVPQLKADAKLKVTIGGTEGETVLATNNAKPPFDNLKVRQAIAHALDRKTIALGVYGFDVNLIGSHFSPLHPAYVDLTGTYPYDPAKAKALLKDAGYPNGFEIDLGAYRERDYAEAVIGYLGAVGIKARLNYLRYAAFRDALRAGKTSIGYQTWGSFSVNDVSAFDGVYFRGGEEDLTKDPQVIADLQKGDGSTDPETRKAAYAKALQRIAGEAYALPMFSYSTNYAFTSDLNFTAQPDEVPRFYAASWK